MSVPLKKNTASQKRYIFLFDGTDIKTTPTIAAGDFKVSIDGGAFNNLATLPSESPAASGQVEIAFSQAETNGDTIAVRWIDQAGAEWDDGAATWETEADTIGEIGARIGAFTGTGVNTILGFLQAMAQKAATLPSDIGGTFTPVTDSLEALRDALRSIPPAGTLADNDLTDILRGDTYTESDRLSGLGDISSRTKLWLTIKNKYGDADTAAIAMVLVSNPGDANDGLQYLNGAASDAIDPTSTIDKTWGSLTVTDEVAGDVTFILEADATVSLTEDQKLVYDIQMLTATEVTTLQTGEVNVTSDVTRAIS